MSTKPKKAAKPVAKKSVAPKGSATKTKKKEADKKAQKYPSLLRGMKDILPKDEQFWRNMSHVGESIAESYGFGYIETPIVEEAALFVRTLGKGTDVVDKEMYLFEDREGKKVSLRPEMTASIARAYIAHGMHVMPQPVKVWSMGPLFRYDRPQAGRYRQFHQFDCETIGVHDPGADAELIVVAYNFLRDLGIDTIVHINSIGTLDDRSRYLVELVAYLRSKRAQLSEESKARITKNPLRVLDSKEEQDQPIIEAAPQIIDWLSDESRNYFMKVIEYLDEMEIPYMLQPRLVRGLDYYTDTVFELYPMDDEVRSQNALGGGGRYNGLIEQIGGQPTPAAGFAIGLERIVLELRRLEEKALAEAQAAAVEGVIPEAVPLPPKIFFAHLGDQASRRALSLIEKLRREGVVVLHRIGNNSLKNQLEFANKNQVTHTVILGQKELQDGSIIIRDMASGIQEIVDQKKLKRELERILQRFAAVDTK